jgi:hypothetical protein
MLKLHAAILTRDGKKEFAVLPYEEFLAVQEMLADAADLLELRKAKRKEGGKRSIPLAEVKKKLADATSPVTIAIQDIRTNVRHFTHPAETPAG